MSSVPKVPDSIAEYRSTPSRTGPLNRAFDILCALVGLVSLSPLFCVIAIAIKCDDGGPVFFAHNRIGKDFRRFRVWKFRSMVPGADRGALLTSPADSRVTRIGRRLRRYKLDELPQLFNILSGDMQLVGARPEVEPYVQMFRPQYEVLLQDRPGITDPATLAHRREEQMFSGSRIERQYVDEILPAKLQLSLDYQQRRTFPSDLGILIRTVFGLIQ
jgi:lipopolysaccharide/colanic/teichoic acid biosynthesis glycosyltransferase